MKDVTDLEDGELRLLEVDNRVVLPTSSRVRVIVTSSDVLHSWAVPSLGIKADAIPGRLNQSQLMQAVRQAMNRFQVMTSHDLGR